MKTVGRAAQEGSDRGAGEGARRPRSGAPARGGDLRGWPLAAPLLLYVILRIPSFFEPHWYTDEAGYVTTARGLLRGKVLYAQVWNNKPPIHLWTIAVDTALLGDSEAALHALTFLSGLLTLAAIAYVGYRLLGRGRATLALLAAAALLGSPLFDAELILPEALLIAPVSWAAALVLTRLGSPDGRRWPLWPALAGALAAVGVGYQQTALADACALAVILAVHRPPGPSLAGPGRRLSLYAGAFAVVTSMWLIPSVIIAGAQNVAYALVGFYVTFTHTRYTGGAGSLARDLTLPAAGLVLAGLALWLRGRQLGPSTCLWLWAVADLLVPAVARQPYPHYLLPSLVPLPLAVASVGRGWRRTAGWPWRGSTWAHGLADLGLRRSLAALGIFAAACLSGWAGSVAGNDWGLVQASSSHGLATYYGGALRVLAHQQSLTAWQQLFDYRVSEDAQVAAWVRRHGLGGSKAVVWSSDAWLYELADLQLLLRTPPIYNDEVLYGSDLNLEGVVASLHPPLIVTEGAARRAYPAIDRVVDGGYRAMGSSQDGNEIVWVRADLVLAAWSG